MKIKKLNRKAQFYIFMALLLSFLVFTIYPSNSSSMVSTYLFQSISQNYIKEAPKVVNAAVFKKQDIFQIFDNYTKNFISYAATKNIDLEVAYVIINKTNIKIVNYLSVPINILIGSQEENLTSNNNVVFNRDIDKLEIKFAEKNYQYQINEEDLQLKFLIRAEEK